MMKRTLAIIFWLLLTCAACFGQTSFQGLTPGVSTARDVERVLGSPVRKDSPTEAGSTTLEYKPVAGTAKIEAEYNDGSVFAEAIVVYLAQPIVRATMIQKFSLPQQADATRVTQKGELREYFGGQALLSLGYASGEARGGVYRITYFSKDGFTRFVHWVQRKPDVPSLNANVFSLRFYPDKREHVAADKRVYQSRFSQSQTTFIGWELNLQHPAPGRRISVKGEAKYYDPTGNLDSTNPFTLTIDAGWKGSSKGVGWGTEESGNWTKGIWRLEVFIDGQLAATGSFEVY